jgi:hypothetical protein
MNFFGGCPTIKLTKIIADTKWTHYAYLRRFMNVKPKNQREVHHENFSSCKNLDRLILELTAYGGMRIGEVQN